MFCFVVPEWDLEWFFVTDHYDVHLKGYAYVKGKLSYVERREVDDYDDMIVWSEQFMVTPLTTLETFHAYVERFVFEQLVGYHWSYRNGKLGNKLQPEWRRKIYFQHVNPILPKLWT